MNKDSKIDEILIIGAGPAGLTAAWEAEKFGIKTPLINAMLKQETNAPMKSMRKSHDFGSDFSSRLLDLAPITRVTFSKDSLVLESVT